MTPLCDDNAGKKQRYVSRRDFWFKAGMGIGGLALIGLCSRKQLRSSANSWAVAYRARGSLASAFSTIVSSSAGIARLIRRRGRGSSKAICRSNSWRFEPA